MTEYLDENLFQDQTLQTLYYDRTDVHSSAYNFPYNQAQKTKKRIDLIRSDNCKECMICHYWFLNHEFKFQDSLCNNCHDLTIISVNKSNIAIMIVKNVDCYCIIYNISKFEAIILLKNSF